jgi:uncharacterized membrane-anchored protein YitT (DUF2179 family)
MKIFILLFGITLSALSFNLFLVPNNFVSPGLTGIAVIISNISEFNASTIVLIGNVILITFSIITLGFKASYKNVVGAILYTGMVYLTKDFADIIHFSFDNVLLYAVAAGIVSGFGEGLVYKLGYSVGGTSILALILSKYMKKTVGSMLKIIGYIIIIFGGLTFGYTAVMYSLIIVYLTSLLVDKIILGISDTKMFLVITNKEKKVKKFVMEIGNCGVTELESRGAYSKEKSNVLMFVVPTEKYFGIKLAIQEIDEKAFIVVSDCYEVLGGTKRKKVPCNKQN